MQLNTAVYHKIIVLQCQKIGHPSKEHLICSTQLYTVRSSCYNVRRLGIPEGATDTFEKDALVWVFPDS